MSFRCVYMCVGVWVCVCVCVCVCVWGGGGGGGGGMSGNDCWLQFILEVG